MQNFHLPTEFLLRVLRFFFLFVFIFFKFSSHFSVNVSIQKMLWTPFNMFLLSRVGRYKSGKKKQPKKQQIKAAASFSFTDRNVVADGPGESQMRAT